MKEYIVLKDETEHTKESKMAKEGISPAGQSGFETDISQEEVVLLLKGFLDGLAEEQRKTLGLDTPLERGATG